MVFATPSPQPRLESSMDDLLLRETNHRCANDLQLVVSLLTLQSRKARSEETRQALDEATERVSVLARSRTALHQQTNLTLEAALRQVCEALHSQAEPRSILVSLEVATQSHALSMLQVTTLSLVVNELATNAIKHAFEVGATGHIRIKVREPDKRTLVIVVDDDGLPFPDSSGEGGGLGLGLVKRLVASIDGLFVSPPANSKVFEIRVPLQHA